MNRLEAFPDPGTMAAVIADRLAGRLRGALERDGEALIALSGGRTPEPVYRRLGQAKLAWNGVTATLADERFVPPGDPASNAGLLARSLFSGEAAEAQFVPLWTEGGGPREAAERADSALKALARPHDAVVLGMGDDGHTASLFPGCPELSMGLDLLSDRRCMAVAAHDPAPPQARLTMTLAELLRSRVILILIQGAAKRQVLEAALSAGDITDMPIRAILRQTRVPVQIAWAPET